MFVRDGAPRSKKNVLKPWQKQEWCIPTVGAAFVARMEDVLDLYAEPSTARRPGDCFDAVPVQLIGERRAPLPMRPGTPARIDCEYIRQGTCNVFVLVNPLRGWRHLTVTDRRANADFAHQMRWLVDEGYPHAVRIRVVLDNLSTHKPEALYETFAPAEARRLLRLLEFHYTPKHGSWLNMAELELSILARQCLAQRVPDIATLHTLLAAYEARRNTAKATITWQFTAEKARVKLHRLYPSNPQ
jgi:transposase